jgi:hypothetical protein
MPPVPPSAPNARPVFPGRDTPLPQPSRQEPETPPRGTARGWFDEFTENKEPEEPQDFGPTGQPTEIPYRYKR